VKVRERRERRRVSEAEAAEAMRPTTDLADPANVGSLFCQCLVNGPANLLDLLRELVTPESLEMWGDFEDVARHLKSIPDVGWASLAHPVPGHPDVAHFFIVSGLGVPYEALNVQPIENVAETLTLVYRGERWYIHAFGRALSPDELGREGDLP